MSQLILFASPLRPGGRRGLQAEGTLQRRDDLHTLARPCNLAAQTLPLAGVGRHLGHLGQGAARAACATGAARARSYYTLAVSRAEVGPDAAHSNARAGHK